MAARKAHTRDRHSGAEWLAGATCATLASTACAALETTMLSMGSTGQLSSMLSLASLSKAACGCDSVAGYCEPRCEGAGRDGVAAGGGISAEARLSNGGMEEMSAASRGGMLLIGGGAGGAQESSDRGAGDSFEIGTDDGAKVLSWLGSTFSASSLAARASCSARTTLPCFTVSRT